VEEDGVIITECNDVEFYMTDTFKQSWKERKCTITSSERWREIQRGYMPTLPDMRDRVAQFMSGVFQINGS